MGHQTEIWRWRLKEGESCFEPSIPSTVINQMIFNVYTNFRDIKKICYDITDSFQNFFPNFPSLETLGIYQRYFQWTNYFVQSTPSTGFNADLKYFIFADILKICTYPHLTNWTPLQLGQFYTGAWWNCFHHYHFYIFTMSDMVTLEWQQQILWYMCSFSI